MYPISHTLISLCTFVAEDVWPIDVKIAGTLLRTCKNLYWCVSYMAVVKVEFYWIPRVAMIYNLYSVLCARQVWFPQCCVGTWSVANIRASIADRVIELACDVTVCHDVRHTASRIVWCVQQRLCSYLSDMSPAVCARMDAVPRERILPGPYL